MALYLFLARTHNWRRVLACVALVAAATLWAAEPPPVPAPAAPTTPEAKAPVGAALPTSPPLPAPVISATASATADRQAGDDGQNPVFLAPADLIRVSMDEDAAVAFEGPVSATGTIPVTYLGEVAVAGQTPAAAAKRISSALCRELYQKATITVTLVNKAPGRVYVYGAVRKPGSVAMPQVGDLTISQVISYVDGLTSWAAPEDAYILRRTKAGEAPQQIKLNLNKVFAQVQPLGDADIALRPDDVVCVPGVNNTLQFTADTCEVIVVGEVNVPGIVRFAPGEQRTVMRAIFKAGGFSKFAKSKAVRLIRYAKNHERSEKTLDAARIIDEGFLDDDIELSPGDMLIVPQKVINFSNWPRPLVLPHPRQGQSVLA